MEKPNFKKICKMYIQQLTNFPYIEKDFDALTDYGLLCKIVSYLNKVIENQNTQNEAITNLYNAFVALKEYVEEFLDSQNFQEMVDAKLEEMAQDGTLENLLNNLLLIKRLDYYLIDNTITQEELQNLFSIERAKIIEFKNGEYTFNEPFRLNSNTTLILNKAHLTMNVLRGFYNFKRDDEFTLYNGNSNIKFIGGILEGFDIAFCHAYNIEFRNCIFKNTTSNHFMEMGAINGLKIINCEFSGQTNPTFKECVQIDDMKYANMPYFDSEDNPTYDLTHCKNVIVDGCIFKPSDDEGFSFGTAFGMHSQTSDDNFHENIIFTNNKVYNPGYAGIRLNKCKGVKITNNYFTSNEENAALIMRFGYYDEDVLIENNIIEGWIYKAMYFSTNPIAYRNFNIINNVFKNIARNDLGTTGLFGFFNPINFTMSYNKFINIDRVLFKINSNEIDPEDPSQLENIGDLVFSNNLIKSLEELNGQQMAIYELNNIEISNNIFNFPKDSTSSSAIVFNSTNVKPFISGNLFSEDIPANRRIALQSNLNVGNVFNTRMPLYSGNTKTFNATPTLDFKKFNTLTVVIGGTSDTYTVNLKGYAPSNKLTARTYKIPFIDANDELQTVTITLNDDNSIVGSSSSDSLFVRSIYGYNEQTN